MSLVNSTLIVALVILFASIIVNTFLYSNTRNETFELSLSKKIIKENESQHAIFKPFVERKDFAYLQLKLKPFKISQVIDPEFFAKPNTLEDDISNNDFRFYIIDFLNEEIPCSLNIREYPFVSKIFQIRLIEDNKHIPENKCVIQIDRNKITYDDLQAFIIMLKEKSDVAASI